LFYFSNTIHNKLYYIVPTDDRRFGKIGGTIGTELPVSTHSGIFQNTEHNPKKTIDLEAVLEQIEEGKNLFIERAKELSEQQEVFNKRIAEPLNLSELGNSSEDKEGNDDILKINFAGRNANVKRSALTKNNFGWNLFSCLFEKRWDGFHVRDREGRIYVDLKGKWLKPLIYCFHQNDINGAIVSPSLFTNRAVEMFN
jgi:hypothetical protein